MFVPVLGFGNAFVQGRAAVVHGRDMPDALCRALLIGVVWAEICVAVPWGLLVGRSCPMRCAVGIGGECVVWVALGSA